MIGQLSATIEGAAAAEFWLTIGFIGIVVLAAGWAAIWCYRRKRAIEDTPTALIRSAPQGYIELQGNAQLMEGEPIYARLSNRLCVWFSYQVEEKRTRYVNNQRRTEWVTVEKETSDDLFFIVDQTGRCVVDPEGASVTPGHKARWYGNNAVPGGLNPADTTMWGRTTGQIGARYRYLEKRIEPGDPLYAIGNFMTRGETGNRVERATDIRELLREWKQDPAKMREFDADQDGQIDVQEWETARKAAEQHVDQRNQAAERPPPIDMLCRTRDARRPFIIAAGTEADIIRKYTWSAYACVVVSLPGAIAFLWAIGIRLSP
ncbi:MAG: GIDE domain-containing protein [Pseudomonadota bacterium]